MQFGRYRFVERLAQGGMAEVFVAVAKGSEGFEKPVVIKRLLPHLADQTRFKQMFLDEARIMLNLQHGNIVQILDMGRMDGVPFLALEYVAGKDLRSVLERLGSLKRTLDAGLIAFIGSEVCRALDFAHRKVDHRGQPLNIVHRDVNPANIFISRDGVVKVGDFGLAKARDNLQHSEAGIIKGKFSYMSPEQAHGEQLDHRTDIFALGITLYEMCCGARPFEAATDIEVLMQVRDARFVPPSRRARNVDPQLEAVILRAMSRDRERRYPTASHMRSDLVNLLQRLPSPPGDRELTAFLEHLFGPERRSQSALITLPAEQALPPVMTSVSNAEGLSEYAGGGFPPPASTAPPSVEGPGGPPRPAVAGQLSPPPHGAERGGAGAGGRRVASPVVTPVATPSPQAAPGTGRGAPKRRSAALAVVLTLILVSALGAGGVVAYRHFRPVSASLAVTSEPSGAQLFLDGRDTKLRTPAVLDGLVVGQQYWVSVRHAEAAMARTQFSPRREGRFTHRFELKPLKEDLQLTSVPDSCDVLVNGELRGQTPLILQLDRGRKHEVELRKTGYVPKTIQHHAVRLKAALRIELERDVARPRRRLHRRAGRHPGGAAEAPRKARHVAAEPEAAKPEAARPEGARPETPAPSAGESAGTTSGEQPGGASTGEDTRPRKGVLEVLTDQAGNVVIDGRHAGRTPGFRIRLAPGTYQVVVTPDGTRIRHEAAIQIEAGRTHRFELTPPG